MENITTAAELKESIKMLEAEQYVKGQELKRHFFLTVESLKPLNLIKGVVQDISTTPFLTKNFIGTASGMATSFLFRRFLPGSTAGLLFRLLGTAIHYGFVTNFTDSKPGIMQSIGKRLTHLFSRKTREVEKLQ
jgi:hypothetical protein